MDVLVQTYITDSAAWLASARVAANGGPATEVAPITEGRYGLFTTTAQDVIDARAILARFAGIGAGESA